MTKIIYPITRRVLISISFHLAEDDRVLVMLFFYFFEAVKSQSEFGDNPRIAIKCYCLVTYLVWIKHRHPQYECCKMTGRHTHTCARTHVHARTHMHTHTHMHTDAHAHTNTHTQTYKHTHNRIVRQYECCEMTEKQILMSWPPSRDESVCRHRLQSLVTLMGES